MTMTRQQLEAVIDRQLYAQIGVTNTATFASGNRAMAVDASRRAILAAVDEWAAGQVAAAVTPIAVIRVRRKITHRTLRRIREHFLAAPGVPVTVLPDDEEPSQEGTR